MERKTEEVYELVLNVLKIIPQPYREDITDKVCLEIEKNPYWLNHYHNLCKELTVHVVNNYIGYYTKSITGFNSGNKATASSKLIKSYTKLVEHQVLLIKLFDPSLMQDKWSNSQRAAGRRREDETAGGQAGVDYGGAEGQHEGKTRAE